VTAETVGHASRLRFLLGAWTVNEATAIRRMIEVGVDVVISDRPDLVIQSLGAR
jgi:glycerophosphoryl diester phosphodiesterase